MATEFVVSEASTLPISSTAVPPVAFRYDAFVSYSHDLRQKAITSRLQQAIEQFAKPFWRRRALSLFRDEINLSANPDLWGTIEEALARSNRLILIASPEAAASKWVGREVAWWLDNRSAASILIVLAAGRLSWVGDQFVAGGTDAIPSALLVAFAQEPLWVDLTGIDPSTQGDGWRRDERFVGAVAGLAASLRGVSKDELYGEDLRRHRQTRRMIVGALSLIASFAVAATGAAIFANSQRLLALQRELTTRIQLLSALARRFDSPPFSAERLEQAGALALQSIHLARDGGQPLDAGALETSRDVIARIPLAVLKHGDGQVDAIAQLADGRIVSGGMDRRLVLWQSANNGAANRAIAAGGPVAAIVKLHDGRLAVAGDGARIWSADLAQPTGTAQLPWASTLALLPDGRLAGARGTEIVVPSTDPDGVPQHLDHGAYVLSIAALPDGRIASGGNDGRILIWPAGGVGAPTVLENGGTVPALAALGDGRLVSGSDYSGLIRVWPEDGSAPITFTHGDTVHTLAVLPDGRIASGGEDGRIKLWSLQGGEATVLENGAAVTALLVLSDGRLASGGSDGNVRIWPTDGGGEPVALNHGSEVYALAVLPDGSLLSAGKGERIQIWTTGSRLPRTQIAHGAGMMALVVLPDGRLASGGFDHKIRFWNADGLPVGRALDQGSEVRSLAVAPDGRLLSGGLDGTVKLWLNDPDRPIVHSIDAAVNATAFLRDGRPVAAGDDGRIRVWPADGQGPPILQEHGGQVWHVVELAGGRIASAGSDGRIRIWTVGSGEPLTVLDHGAMIYSLEVLRDGRLASGGLDGRIRIWPADGRGQPVDLQQGAPVFALQSLPDGRLASGGEDGIVRLWLVEPDQIVSALCQRAGRELSAEEWSRYMGEQPRRSSCPDRSSAWRQG